MNYFSKLYKSKHVNLIRIKNYLGKIDVALLSEEIKAELNKKVSEEEILNAIKSMKPNKSPDPDGFTTIFYKKL